MPSRQVALLCVLCVCLALLDSAHTQHSGSGTGPVIVRLLTVNLANYNDHPHWPERCRMIATLIADNRVDVAALQENRFDASEQTTAETHLSMSNQLVEELAGLGLACSVVDNRAQYYDPVTHDVSEGVTTLWEGLSLVSCQEDIISATTIFLKHPPGSGDGNRRVTQVVTLSLPERFDTELSVVNTHFSYAAAELATNVNQTIDALTRLSLRAAPFVVVGDMNATPDNAGLHALSTCCTDVWSYLHRDDQGFTFPSTSPSKRIDFIWASPAMLPHIRDVRIVLTSPVYGVFASDHFGLLAELAFK
mmetsp:Transcript_6477/g.16355  ORF Transcript_6477/g.16355 Transcript_6477/m.16355 type:complete len:306 (-) Transcript_6477:1636-2553(-)